MYSSRRRRQSAATCAGEVLLAGGPSIGSRCHPTPRSGSRLRSGGRGLSSVPGAARATGCMRSWRSQW